MLNSNPALPATVEVNEQVSIWREWPSEALVNQARAEAMKKEEAADGPRIRNGYSRWLVIESGNGPALLQAKIYSSSSRARFSLG